MSDPELSNVEENDVDEIKAMMNSLQPYQFEPEREVSDTDESEEDCTVKKTLLMIIVRELEI